MTVNEIKEYILKRRNEIIKDRDDTRGSGVYLSENIMNYFIQIGEFYEIDRLCAFLGLTVESYNPYEKDEDDLQFNYCGASGAFGKEIEDV